MKLKNKEENKLEELEGVYIADGKIFMMTIDEDGKRNLQSFDTLVELNKTFEDYKEEPKGTYFINTQGDVQFWDSSSFAYPDDWTKEKEIGNYFETKEEAEKAVEKLRALKRLKDKGFKICGWNMAMRELDVEVPEKFFDKQGSITMEISDETRKDLDLLFSGGEE